jgi:SPP1 family predicted phage head-tail adaptor
MSEAGKLSERITLSARVKENPDSPIDYGNTEAGWSNQGTIWAEFIHLRGGEAVIAGRLQGRHAVVMRVRASALTREVGADWRVIDARGTAYAVRDITVHPKGDRQWLDLLCESGVAA